MPPPGSVCDYRHIVTLKKLAAQEEAGWFSLVKIEAGNIFIFIFFQNLEKVLGSKNLLAATSGPTRLV